MLQVIISIIGLIIAVFVFALIADKFPSITNCIPLAYMKAIKRKRILARRTLKERPKNLSH